jgi:four helix bundle protein
VTLSTCQRRCNAQDTRIRQDFKRLKVWEKAHRLVLRVYKNTRHLPEEERYGLTRQLRRSAASIPANIAEGCGRSTNPDLARFLDNAIGSASELEYHLLLAKDLDYLAQPEYETLTASAVEVKRMLGTLIPRIRSQPRRPRTDWLLITDY